MFLRSISKYFLIKVEILFSTLVLIKAILDDPCSSVCQCKIYKNKNVADCDNAGFSTIPSMLDSNFHVLDLTNNKIMSLERHTFKKVNLVNLHRLILKGNKISYVDKDAFSHLALLLDLDLSENRISMLHPETFTGLDKMRRLTLSANFLTRLDYHQFPKLENLHHLSIDKCNLSYVNNEAFSLLSNVKSIRLNGNSLQTLKSSVFERLVNLKSVELRNNQWNCSCKLRDLVFWYQQTRMAEGEVTCSFPERLSTRRWADLKDGDLACTPQIIIPETKVPAEIDENATLSCGARGDPMPSVNWVWAGRIVNHGSIFSSKSNTEPDAKLLLKAQVMDGISWLNLTVVQLKVGFLINVPNQMIIFKCVIENAAQNIEKNVTLYVKNSSSSGFSLEVMYIIMACIFVIILIAVICLLVVFCFKRERNRRKNFASTSNEKNFLEKNNILIVNPVEKPPRHYEGDGNILDSEVEMVNLLAGKSNDVTEEEIDHLELSGRIRAPLTALQEEEFGGSDSQEPTGYSESVFVNKGLSDQYPDLLGSLNFARTLSPAQYPHCSFNRSMYNNLPVPWRHSVMYSSDGKSNFKRFSHLPQPAFCQRSGYVTLPRRPRTSSAASSSSFVSHSQYSDNMEPLYDTLGPRTTADGTSNLNLSEAPLCPTPVKLFPNQKIKAGSSSFFTPIVQLSPQHCTLPRLSRKLSGSDSFYFSNRDNFKYRRTSPSHFRSIICANKEENTIPSSANVGDSSIDEACFKEQKSEDSSSTSCFLPLREDLSDTSELIPSKSPPPKPLAKPCNTQIPSTVLSALASSNSSSGTSLLRSYQDEGPDGTEV